MILKITLLDKKLILFIFTIFFQFYSIAQKTKQYEISESELNRYLKLSEQETRLLEFKDDKSTLILKLKQLAHINKSRKKYKKQTVELDILASRVANKISKNAALNKFMGHFNTQGHTPYHRYSLAGGTSHVSENASALSSSDRLPSSDNDLIGYMQKAHNAFMAERAPHDGHKQNCINPHHNFVGLGYYIHNGEFRYYEEFIDKYLEFGHFKNSVNVNQTIKIPVKALNSKYVYMSLAYYEKKPTKMSISSINNKKKYDDYTNKIAKKILPWELPKKSEDGFTQLEFKFNKKGWYYIHIYINDKPYKSGTASTKNKIQASGVVIQVN